MALLVPEAPASIAPQGLPDVRRTVAGDREALVRFFEGLSPTASQRRFLTGMGGSMPRTLVDQLLVGGRGGGALVAVVPGRIVAHALWAPTSGQAGPVAEIALVVADDCQRQGIGSLLLEALTAEMVYAGIERVQVVTGADNRPVLAMLRTRRPGVRPIERDGPVVTYELPVAP